MAGNPFRKQPAKDPNSVAFPEEPSKAFDDAIRAAITPEAGRRASAVKKVRIQTPPPLSPDPASPPALSSPPVRRLSNEGHAGSPPPQSPIEELTSTGVEEDPFDTRFPEDVMSQPAEVTENTRRNSETHDAKPIMAEKILNPFQKTLATMEPGERHSSEVRERDAKKLGDSSAAGKAGGGGMDVDSFTRMLMTGKSGPGGGPGPAQQSHSGRQFPDNSSTDVSSASRQSLFDADNKTRSDSLSTTSSDSSSGNEDSAPAPVPATKSKPPPPAHRQGKLVPERAPQTVSFSEFEDFTANTPAADPSASISSSSVARDRDISTLSTSTNPSAPARGLSSSTTDQPGGSRSAADGGQRAPPPVPLARKRGQIYAALSEKSTTSSITAGPGPTSPDPFGKSSKAPPPPPSRRGTGKMNIASDQAAHASDPPMQLEEFPADPSSKRISFNPAAESSRSSSLSERTAIPPPPPPRRRRGSSRSSAEVPVAVVSSRSGSSNRMSGDFRRTSQDSTNFRRVAGLTQVSEGEDSQKSKDVLADLSAFQAEVDALHAAARRTT